MATVVDCAEFGTLTLDAPSDELALFGRAGLRSVMSATGVAAHRLSRSGADPDDQANNETATITAGRRAVIWPLAGPVSSPGMAYWMVACSVYLYIAILGANVRIRRGQGCIARVVMLLGPRAGCLHHW